MKEISYLKSKIIGKIKKRSFEEINKLFIKNGMKIGENTKINCNIITPESYLIEIGNNVTLSNNVQLITHDNSISKVIPNKTDFFGKIIIGDNSFIGARSIILPGVKIMPNTIIAAGSVVTKSFKESNIIIGGNPAKIIGNWDDFFLKGEKAQNMTNVSYDEKKMFLLEKENLIEK